MAFPQNSDREVHQAGAYKRPARQKCPAWVARDSLLRFILAGWRRLFYKANVSGGGSVGVRFGRGAVEAKYTGGTQPFVEYLRSAFLWAGFLGFEHIRGAPQPFLRGLGKGLLAV